MFLKGGEADDKENLYFIAEYEAVYRYVLSLCRNETEAQDITQDTFLKAMQAKNGFRGNSSVYTWLCAIAKNVWLDKMRKQNRLMPMREEALEDGKSLEEKIANEDTAIQVHKILHMIKEPYKEVFSLRVLDNCPLQRLQRYLGKQKAGQE